MYVYIQICKYICTYVICMYVYTYIYIHIYLYIIHFLKTKKHPIISPCFAPNPPMFHGTERRSVHLQRLLPRCRQQRQGAAPAAETRGEAAKVCEAPGVMAKW